MYQALYRKWRPKVFDDVIGQEHITETLKTQVRTGHLSHAYIFIGTRGTGKTTCARILAKAVNCENPVNGNPCNRCRSCIGIEDGSILDIVELDAASNTGVDNVRDLREEAIFSPAAAKKRVYIIDEVHMLSLAAFNALLKIIEEPPEHLIFILATTELQKVPATILSRCQRHSFRRIPGEKLAAYIADIAGRENLVLESDAALQIARLAEGGVRDALSILDQCSVNDHITIDTVFETMGLAGNRNLTLFLRAVICRDIAQALLLFQKSWLDGKEPASFLGELNSLLRDILIVKAAPAGAGELISGNYEQAVLSEFSSSMTKEELLYCADTVQNAMQRMKQVRNQRTVAEVCIVNLCDSRTEDSILALRARVSRLEEMLQNTDRSMIPSKAEHTSEPLGSEYFQNPAPVLSPNVYEIHDPKRDANTGSNIENTKNLASGFDNSHLKSSEPDKETIQISKRIQDNSEYSENSTSNNITEADSPKESGTLEQAILSQVRDKLPIELRFSLEDSSKFRISLDRNELLLEALPGFLLDRMKRPEIRASFSEVAERVLGHHVAIRLAELNKNERAIRDINELKQYKEVTFIA